MPKWKSEPTTTSFAPRAPTRTSVTKSSAGSEALALVEPDHHRAVDRLQAASSSSFCSRSVSCKRGGVGAHDRGRMAVERDHLGHQTGCVGAVASGRPRASGGRGGHRRKHRSSPLPRRGRSAVLGTRDDLHGSGGYDASDASGDDAVRPARLVHGQQPPAPIDHGVRTRCVCVERGAVERQPVCHPPGASRSRPRASRSRSPWAGVSTCSGASSSRRCASASPNDPTFVLLRPLRCAPPPSASPRSAAKRPARRCRSSSRPRYREPRPRPGTSGHLEPVDCHPPRLTLHLDSLARERVEPLPSDLDRRHHRRHLLDPTGELARRCSGLFDRHPRHVPGARHLARGVEASRSTSREPPLPHRTFGSPWTNRSILVNLPRPTRSRPVASGSRVPA